MRNIDKAFASFAIVISIIIIVEMLAVKSPAVPTFTIETVSSTCMTGEQDLDIRAVENSIVIIAPIQTPNPCYSVTGDVKFSGGDIEVELSTVSKQEICVQCIGEVIGKVVIQNLPKGIYGVKLRTPDKALITTITIE